VTEERAVWEPIITMAVEGRRSISINTSSYSDSESKIMISMVRGSLWRRDSVSSSVMKIRKKRRRDRCAESEEMEAMRGLLLTGEREDLF
jgi:hypothetical protein